MNELREFIERGGPVMYGIIALSIALYTRSFLLLRFLARTRRHLQEAASSLGTNARQRRFLRDELVGSFRAQRFTLSAMVAAAPLLGLLGTVNGMIIVFANLSTPGAKSMDLLSEGISEVLVATQSGLAVAIPGIVVIYFGHLQVQRCVQILEGVAKPQEVRA